MKSDIKFPIIEITQSLFESEKVFFVLEEWTEIVYLKKQHLNNQNDRILLDSDGKLLQIKSDILKEPTGLFKFINNKYTVKLTLVDSNKRLEINDAKEFFASKSSEHFHITDNKLMSENQFRNRVSKATSYEELIYIAGFEIEGLDEILN